MLMKFKMGITYPIKFKAAVLEINNEPLKVQEITFDGPLESGQVLVKIHYSGICGKQIEEIKGSSGPDKFLPHMLGHEGGGIVVDTASDVTTVSKGDHVVLHWLQGSGINSVTPMYYKDGKRINAGWVTTFNEYGVISENRVTIVPKDLDLKIGCLFGCATTTGVGVVFNNVKLKENESITIVGCGGVGLNAIQAAALSKGNPIIAIDINDESLILAKKFGATHIINSKKTNMVNEIYKITNHQGAKHVVLTLGNANGIETAINASSIPGTVYFVGVPPKSSEIKINPFSIHMLRTLKGSCGGETTPDIHIPLYVKMYQKGKLKLDELITDYVSLDQINIGIDKVISGENGRCVVRMKNNE